MSHFTHIKTCFQNLFYLKKALDRQAIPYSQREQTTSNLNSTSINLVISQPNGYDFEFCWNGQEYELVADLSFWKHKFTVEKFIGQIGQQYTTEVTIGESQKIGFQPIEYQQQSNGSKTLVLERWNLA